MAECSSANRLADVADFFYSLRQSSPVAPKQMILLASEQLQKNPSLELIAKYGLAMSMLDLDTLAAEAKKECFKKSMEEIDRYITLPPSQKYLFRYECFLTNFTDRGAASDLARNLSPAQVSEMLNTLENGTLHVCLRGVVAFFVFHCVNHAPMTKSTLCRCVRSVQE